jgi:hypothetical protein
MTVYFCTSFLSTNHCVLNKNIQIKLFAPLQLVDIALYKFIIDQCYQMAAWDGSFRYVTTLMLGVIRIK